MLIGFPSPLLCLYRLGAFLGPGSVSPPASSAPSRDLPLLCWALSLSFLSSSPVGACGAPRAPGLLAAVPLEMPPLEAVVALLRGKGGPERFALKDLGLPDYTLVVGRSGFILVRN